MGLSKEGKSRAGAGDSILRVAGKAHDIKGLAPPELHEKVKEAQIKEIQARRYSSARAKVAEEQNVRIKSMER